MAALGALIFLSACAIDNGPAESSTSDVVALSPDALRKAAKTVLVPGAEPVAGSETFATHAFWANLGETVHLGVQSNTPGTSSVFRTTAGENIDYTPTPDGKIEGQFDRSIVVASGQSEISFVVPHTGIHYVTIGSQANATPIVYSVALTVERTKGTVGVEDIAAAGDMTCALVGGGVVKCWGYDPDGNGMSIGSSPETMGASVPTVVLPRPAVALSGGTPTMTALLDDGSVYRWKKGDSPTVIALADKATSIQNAACAMLASGQLQCWTDTKLTAPLEWPGRTISHWAGADGHFCALLDDQTAACSLVAFALDKAPAPKAITLANGENVLAMAASDFANCLVTNLGTRCASPWTDNDFRWGFSNVVELPMANGKLERIVLEQDDFAVIALMDDGTAWRRYGEGEPPFTYRWKKLEAFDGPIETVAAQHTLGSDRTCAVLRNGTAKCFGENLGGQLGVGDYVNRFPTSKPSPTSPDATGQNLPALDLGAPY